MDKLQLPDALQSLSRWLGGAIGERNAMAEGNGRTRQMWQLLEPLHAVLSYAPEVFAEAGALGYDTAERWPSYFAWRAAPLGTPDAAEVTAAFHSFSPRTVAEHVPVARDVAGPDKLLEARVRAIGEAYRAVLGGGTGNGPELAEAAALARRAAEAADTEGRPLAAANAALPWPEGVPRDPVLARAVVL